MTHLSRRRLVSGLAATSLGGLSLPAEAQSGRPKKFETRELVESGHQFFGTISRGLAQVVEAAGRRWGQPNAYILGQEASGAFFAGLRFGEGVYAQCGRPADLLAGPFSGIRRRRRWRPHHDAGL